MRRSGWHQMRVPWAREAGIGFTNVVNIHPAGNNFETLLCSKKDLPHDYPPIPPLGRGKIAYLRPEFLDELKRLQEELQQANPFCVVSAGATATWAVLGRADISNVRGTATVGSQNGVCPGVKVVPTYHPSAIIRGRMDWRVVCIADFLKAGRESSRPGLDRPAREALVNPTLPEIKEWSTKAIERSSIALAVDCETKGPLITCISFADSSTSAITIPFRSANGTTNYWTTEDDELRAWHEVRQLLECGRPLVFQNGMYDMQYLIRMGFNCKNARHDTMLLHHSLYPEVQKSLGFLGSIYTNESSWKLLRKQRATKIKGDKLDE
jgi:hypothetical protein